MNRLIISSLIGLAIAVSVRAADLPLAAPPYYRVEYDASSKPGELAMPVTYTIWIPEGVKTLRGVIVHQHNDRCGKLSCGKDPEFA